MSRRLIAERRRTFLALAALALAGVLLALWSGPAHAATFTVNRTGDAPDANLANARCDANASQRGNQCTLRAAIQEANDATGADLIRFNIVSNANVKTISPASALPTITEQVTINGYTQSGASENTLGTGNNAVLKVQLNGTNAGTFADGLTITGANSAIKGLVINRFGESGVRLSGSGATDNKVEGNFIGTNASGTRALGRARDGGVNINGAPDNTIGGPEPGARNVISGNVNGIRILFSGATGNKVEGNFIGTNASGTKALGNTGAGMFILGAPTNTVGGTQPAQRNVISGNGNVGIEISGATGNEVQGNRIGTNAAGTAALGNDDDGVFVTNDASNNTIGGTESGVRNIISGNGSNGVEIGGSGATGNEVLGNFVGTDASGTVDLGNTGAGVEISSGAENTVGETTTGARNVISGNQGDGVEMRDGAPGNEVEGNFIGTKANGIEALGNSGNGVDISQAEANTIGGTTAAARNIISANGGDGVVIFGDRATGNKVQGNFIGTGADGTTALGNDDGVVISSGSESTIGSAIGTTGGGNRIAHNDQDGVLVFGGLAVGNRILSNSIFSNGELGIDLAGGTEDSFGVTANDADDPDAPSSNNHRQNFPVITSAIRSNSNNFTTIRGTLNSNPNQNYLIQCFVAAPDPSGHGEGQIPVAQTTATTNASGDASFACVSPVPQAGQLVSATATNTSGTASGTSIGDTSEFSRIAGVVTGP